MIAALERRMTRLEEAANPGANRIAVVVWSIISTAGNAVVRAIFDDKVVDRRADETEDDFMERATAEALAATTQRPCRVILLPEDALE